MTAQAGFVMTLPDVIAWLGARVTAEASRDDETAQELAKCLDLSWAFAERWRIEQSPELLAGVAEDVELDDLAEPAAAPPSGN